MTMGVAYHPHPNPLPLAGEGIARALARSFPRWRGKVGMGM
jgi:hypothetical protein